MAFGNAYTWPQVLPENSSSAPPKLQINALIFFKMFEPLFNFLLGAPQTLVLGKHWLGTTKMLKFIKYVQLFVNMYKNVLLI